MTQKSVTIDEIMYIGAGYYHLRTGDFQMNMTNPPFMKILSALPLLPIDLRLPSIQGDPRDWTIIQQWQYARAFLYNNTKDAELILFLARLPSIVVSVVLGLYVFRMTKELYGEKASCFAVFLYAFSPTMLAYSRFATQDLGVTAFMFISTYYWWTYIRNPNGKALTQCGIFLGIAMLTKLTAVFLLIAFAAHALFSVLKTNRLGVYSRLPIVRSIDPKRPRLRQLTSISLSLIMLGLLTVLTINLGCAFQGTLEPLAKKGRHSGYYERLSISSSLTRELSELILTSPIPLPSPYVESVKFQFSNSIQGKASVSVKEKSRQLGRWLAAFSIKTPVAMLILVLLGICYLIRHRNSLEVEWLILIFVFTFAFIVSYLSDTYWVRYLLPIYPFLYLLVSGHSFTQLRKTTFGTIFLCGLSIWYLISSLMIYPHYLAYANELIGGPENGYKYLTDSNIDWGQDLKGLKVYMEEKNIDRIKLGYFGSADAEYYGIDYEYLPSVGLAPNESTQYWWYEIDDNHRYDPGPQKGYLAVSATLLASPRWLKPLFHETYQWLREYDPIDQIGYSILIFNIE
jgi:hypothetical protein